MNKQLTITPNKVLITQLELESIRMRLLNKPGFDRFGEGLLAEEVHGILLSVNIIPKEFFIQRFGSIEYKQVIFNGIKIPGSECCRHVADIVLNEDAVYIKGQRIVNPEVFKKIFNDIHNILNLGMNRKSKLYKVTIHFTNPREQFECRRPIKTTYKNPFPTYNNTLFRKILKILYEYEYSDVISGIYHKLNTYHDIYEKYLNTYKLLYEYAKEKAQKEIDEYYQKELDNIKKKYLTNVIYKNIRNLKKKEKELTKPFREHIKNLNITQLSKFLINDLDILKMYPHSTIGLPLKDIVKFSNGITKLTSQKEYDNFLRQLDELYYKYTYAPLMIPKEYDYWVYVMHWNKRQIEKLISYMERHYKDLLLIPKGRCL